MEACFNASFREESTGREAPGAQEFITKEIEELQEAQAMPGEGRPARSTIAAAAPNVGGGLRICVKIPSLNRAAS